MHLHHPMNHIKVSFQGPHFDGSSHYLWRHNPRKKPQNDTPLLTAVKNALRGFNASQPHRSQSHWLPDPENPEGRELFWHTKEVLLSYGGNIVKKWGFFEETEDIQTACLGFMEQNVVESRKWFSPSPNYASVADDEGPPVASSEPAGRPIFGPFGAREQRPRKFPDEHELIPAVFIFFRSMAKIYLQNGMSYVVSLPFVVRKAWPIAPHGVMVQRILEPVEYMEASLAGETVLPTIFTITSPFAEPAAVGLATKISGGMDNKPVVIEEDTKNVLTSLPPTEMVIEVSLGNTSMVHHRKHLVVTVDTTKRTWSIWRYAYAKPNQPNQPPPSNPMAKKRQSMGNHNRRTSAAFEGDRLDSKHHAPPKDLGPGDLASLGAAAAMGAAASMSSVLSGAASTQSSLPGKSTRESLIGTGPDSDPLPTADERMKANYWMECICKERLDDSEDINLWQEYGVSIWDERFDGSHLTSLLGIVLKPSMGLKVTELRYDDHFRITFKQNFQFPAMSTIPVIATRPNITDLLVVQPNGGVYLLGQGTCSIGFEFTDPVARVKEYQSVGVPKSAHGRLVGFEDARHSLVSLVFSDGYRERVNMDMCFKDKLVTECMQMLSLVLPAESYFHLHMYFINEWSIDNRVHDAEIEFKSFKAALYRHLNIEDAPPPASETQSGWERLANTTSHRRFREDPALRRLKLPPKHVQSTPKPLSNPPHPMHSVVMYTLHILAEDLRLLKNRQDSVVKLAPLIARLALPVRPEWTEYWKRLIPDAFNGWPHMSQGSYNLSHVDDKLPIWPYDVMSFLYSVVTGIADPTTHWRTPMHIAKNWEIKPAFAHDMVDPLADLHEVLSLFAILGDSKAPGAQKRAEMAIHKLVTGVGVDKIEMLPLGIALPLREALRTCQLAPPAHWPLPSYSQIGRNDLAASASDEPERMFTEGYRPAKDFMNPTKPRPSIGSIVSEVKTAATGEIDTISGVELNQEDFTQIRFGQDRRLGEVARLLNSSVTQTIKIPERAELSEHDQAKEHQTHIARVAERTLALPFGRAMFTFGSMNKVTREAHSIPKIEYGLKILPHNITFQPEVGKVAPDALQWGEFHNGVAAGLRIGPLAKGVESSWITFNKPSELTPEHAGFLFALGLTGHLKELMTWHTFQYLTPKHDQTSIAVLLGLAASNIGKGTQKVVKLIAVHTPALLPTPNVDLNVHLLTQAAGLSGLGLLYLGMRNRRMAEVCLSEISRKDLLQPDLSNEHREAYTFSAAIAFGMIMLGKGSSIPADLDLLARLNALIHGDPAARKHERSANPFDINLTSPAAAIAMGLMYLKTERQDVADMLSIPDTPIALNRIQPNFLMIRTIARALILWEKVAPTHEWILGQVPESIRVAVDPFKGKAGDDAFELAYYHILAGCCFAIGLKYAGTARQEAYSVIVKYYDQFSRFAYTSSGPAYDQKIKRAAVRDGLNQISLALCMVMAGTGEISCLRRIRFSYGIFQQNLYHPNFRYGVHLATMQSLGLLFLGGGRYTLGTSDAAIACMVAAFFPRSHVAPSDNKCYLQALRHLWVLAVEPRCLIARDVDTGEVVYLPVKITVKEGETTGTSQLISPTLIPDINKVQSIRVDTPRYWPFYLDIAGLQRHKEALLRNQTLYVKRRTAFLSYTEDPRGSRSLFVRSGSSAGDAAILDFPQIAAKTHPASDLSEFITSFSNNIIFLAFADHLCRYEEGDGGASESERVFHIYCHAALLDCIMQDKPQTLQTHLSLYKYRNWSPRSNYFHLVLQDLRFASDFYSKLYDRKFSGRQENNARPGLVRDTAVMGAFHNAKQLLEEVRSREDFLEVVARYAKNEPLGELPTITTESGETVGLDQMLAWYLVDNWVPGSMVLEYMSETANSVLTKNVASLSNPAEQLGDIRNGLKEVIHLTGSKMVNNPISGWSLRSLEEISRGWNVNPATV
ncbi:anaphase promoting complex subunit 1 [Coprinopsis marcescibilis]|uniref:Anaphase promoting complex subunit 1 n=1 Tax=Coprinopsis marcescibilis TaxID=230819 RepID=A0A5C3KWJ1_COPMA|nr:anaphase promoting complex subunit 1 [Coprinopsis marcescibilis]